MTTSTMTRRAPQSKAALAKAMKQKLADMAPQPHEGALVAEQNIKYGMSLQKMLADLSGPSIFEQTLADLYPQRFIHPEAVPVELSE